MAGQSELLCREDSIVIHSFKKIRSTAFVVTFFSGLGITIWGLLSGGGQGGGKKPSFLQLLKENVSWNTLVPLIIAAIAGAIAYLIYDYLQSRKLKRSELAEKLRKDLCGYYQGYCKDRVDKIVQDILLAVESEDQRLKAALERVGEQFANQLVEMKKRLEDLKLRQTNLGKERAIIERAARA